MCFAQDWQTVDDRVIRKNRFCYGVKVNKRYVCSGEVDDPKLLDETINLLVEAVNRILKWRVWDQWWIDSWRQEWESMRDNVERQFRGRYSDVVVNDLLIVINDYISYIDAFKESWVTDDVGSEIRRLIEDLRNGGTEIIVRRTSNSLVSSIYGKYVSLIVKRPGKGVIVHLDLSDLKATTIKVPDIWGVIEDDHKEFIKIKKDVLMALKLGFAATDEGVNNGKPTMNTSQPWQVLLWSLLYPGEISVRINAISVNVRDVSMLWYLGANDHTSFKDRVFKITKNLNDKALLVFMLAAVLGDGYAGVKKPRIRLVVSASKLDMWRPIFNKLDSMGFKARQDPLRNTFKITYTSGYAIDLARAMINALPSVLIDLLDALGIKKWLDIKQVANTEVRFRLGESRVLVGGEAFTVAVSRGSVRLVRRVRDWVEVEKVLEHLKSGYGDYFVSGVRIHRSGGYLVVAIPARLVKSFDDVKASVVEVLCRKYWRAKDDGKRREIIKALSKLVTAGTYPCLSR